MKTFLLDIADRFRRFDEQLDVKALLCNKSWQVFNDSGVKEIYIFQEDGSLISLNNGEMSKAIWKYTPTNCTLDINLETESFTFRPFFLDDHLFVLQLEGKEEFSFWINNSLTSKLTVKSLSDIKFYLEHKEQSMLQLLIEKESKRKKILQQFIDGCLSRDEYYLMLKRKLNKGKKLGIILILFFWLLIYFSFTAINGLISSLLYPLGIVLTLLVPIYLVGISYRIMRYQEKEAQQLSERFNRKYPEDE